MTAWQCRLALRWVEFQGGACKVNTKSEAYKTVASEFGPRLDTVIDWRRTVAKTLGQAAVRESWR